MKVNIEGDEYALLYSIIKAGNHKRIKNILVQFHDFIPNHKELKKEIEVELLKTHDKVFSYEFIWEHWKLRE